MREKERAINVLARSKIKIVKEVQQRQRNSESKTSEKGQGDKEGDKEREGMPREAVEREEKQSRCDSRRAGNTLSDKLKNPQNWR